MKAQLLKLSLEPERSFSVRRDITAKMNGQWHFHEEIEMVQFHQDGGVLFIGDDIRYLHSDDIVLIGPNLPHCFRCDVECPITEGAEDPLATVVHFSDRLLGEEFFRLSESRAIKNILDAARRGILLKACMAAETGHFIEKIYASEGMSRMIALLECLQALADCGEIICLSSQLYNYADLAAKENERLNAIYYYTLNNFKRRIYLDEIAGVANMAPNSFCRYFKSISGKTYSQFLVGIKVGHACKLLMMQSFSIKQVCFESGFHNFSCFHKTFKLIKGTTPQGYRQLYWVNGS